MKWTTSLFALSVQKNGQIMKKVAKKRRNMRFYNFTTVFIHYVFNLKGRRGLKRRMATLKGKKREWKYLVKWRGLKHS